MFAEWSERWWVTIMVVGEQERKDRVTRSGNHKPKTITAAR